MNADQVAALRALLAPTGWLDRTAGFARALRRSARTPNGLLIIGTVADEPWHMTAHLADESRLAGLPELAPTLVRWSPPPGAPPHLSVGLDRLRAASREETLLVVSQALAPAELLERVHDVRRAGATIFALDGDDPELNGLAHESLPVPAETAPLSFDAAQHLVSSAVCEELEDRRGAGGRHRAAGRRTGRAGARAAAQGELPVVPAPAASARGDDSIRTRLARLLDAVSGSAPD
jgi:hypothetical protein